MKSEEIPDLVQRFVLTSIPSVPFLEALLLLQAAENEPWDAGRLARRLYLAERAAAALLVQLNEAGFAAEAATGVFHYAPRSDEIRGLVASVREAYARNLVGVTNLIHAKTSKKAQHFSDAFKLRKDS
ncbi:MAG TPA: hypothetical protein VIM12_13915 [Noviherbaspirillum sp.]|jgi:hypothetical protein|uniref:hypothetical protein n=1 Tax=Noviherbaspirillum sp. TaxID=1926288 RepID=UPI002F956E60